MSDNALELIDTAESGDEQQTVVFRLSEEFYGIDIFAVNEIIRLREITPNSRERSRMCVAW